ncbi:hypothetical protein ACFE04_026465 [Oxalis oulophora]
MADVVQYRLERMVDELDDMEKRGLFTRREIAEIVKQRRKYEYRLKRPSPLKQDYLAYIDYETQIDSLRRLRKRAVARAQGDKKMRKSVSDNASVARIVEVFRLAVMRFKGDVDLWFKYVEFCRQRSNGRIKKALAQLMRFHPKVPGVWIYAAAWEFDHNLNYEAAHALMLNGLRVCPKSEDLWVEYLRMELTYLNKLKHRKVLLGEDTGTLARDQTVAAAADDDKQWKDENEEELFMSLDDKKGEKNDVLEVENEEPEKKVDFGELGFKFFQTIYNGAVEALPSSFSVRKRFLEILEATDLANSKDLRKELISDMKRDFAKEPEYWVWLARLEVGKAVEVYEEALKFVPSAEMYQFYTKFLMDNIGDAQTIESSSDYTSQLLTVYEDAERMGCLSEDLACQYVSFYLEIGRIDEGRKLAEKLCCGKFSNSAKLWLLRASVEIRCIFVNSSFPSKAELVSLFELLKDVLGRVPISDAGSLWLMKLLETAIYLVAKDGDSEDGFSVSSAIVNFVLQKDGIHRAREIYKRFLCLPHPGLVLYKNCIALESNLASSGDKDSLANAHKLFESALATYDQNIELWKDYHSIEIKMGTSESANAIYWRARKTLKDFSYFASIAASAGDHL